VAFSGMGPDAASGRRGRRRFGGSLAEMNVVPLVDVVLVLLIIFMLTASVMEFGLEVDVPTVKTSQTTAEELPVVAINNRGELYLNSQAVNINLLGSEIRKRFPDQKDVYLRADKSIPWQNVAEVISALGEAKYSVKTVTKPEDIRGRK
jgi:biopolymer transport protein ExbD